MLSGQQLKQNGQRQVMLNAGDEFNREVMDAFKIWTATRKRFGFHDFRFEEFRTFAETVGIIPHSANFWGTVPAMAIKAKLIRATGRYEKASSPKTRHHPVAIYEII